MSLHISKPGYAIVVSTPPPLFPSGAQDTQVLTNVNGSNTWSYPQYFYKGSNMFPENTVNITDISGVSGFQGGGALAPNGNIYFGPFTSLSQTLKVNPYTNTTTTIPNTSLNGFGYNGTTTSENASIYMLPTTDTSNVLVINTLTNDDVSYIGSNDISLTSHYGLVNFNRNVYIIPRNSSSVLRIDTSNNNTIVSDASLTNITTTRFATLGTNINKFAGGVLGSDGKIYCIPSEARRVLRFTPTTASQVPEVLTSADVSGYVGGVLSPNNRIYMIPYVANNIGIIDISNSTISTSLSTFINTSGVVTDISTLGTTKFHGGVLGPNGNIYCMPDDNSNNTILYIDTSSNLVRSITFGTESQSYGGGVLASNGKIYMAPLNATNVPSIKTGIPVLTGWQYANSLNKNP
jgi:hypothetical protein